MELTWVAFPVPSIASTPNAAKVPASHSHFLPRPFLMKYIGPPTQSPWAFRSRKRTASVTSANFVHMPSSAETQIQNTAPGPPSATAPATPAMFPTPTVAASAVQTA